MKLDIIKEITQLPGAPGDEGLVASAIIEKIKGHCDYKIDPLGNVLVFKEGRQRPKKRLLLSAHMDEVGFLITYIEEDGLLRIATAGGIDPLVTVGKRVLVGKSAIPGVIGLKPIHLLEKDETDKLPKAEELLIDIGAVDKKQAEALVSIGDRAVFQSDFIEFGDGFIKAKALDDRAGCALLIELICGTLEYDCYFAFTVQEENGCIGGITAAYSVEPDIGIAVETTTAGDIALAPDHKKVCRLGAGPVVSFMDRGTVYDMGLFKEAMRLSAQTGIPCQSKQGVFGGNESRSVQTARGGARVLAVSMPCRYLHSPSCVLSVSDIESTLRLLHLLTCHFPAL